MKSLKLLSAIALIALPSTALQAAPTDNPGAATQELRDFCISVVLPLLPDANLGECISYGEAFGKPGFAAHACDTERELNPDFEADFGTYANCVRLLMGG